MTPAKIPRETDKAIIFPESNDPGLIFVIANLSSASNNPMTPTAFNADDALTLDKSSTTSASILIVIANAIKVPAGATASIPSK